MKRFFALLLTLLLLPLACHAEAPDWKAQMDDYVAKRFAARKIVGGAVVIARDGQVLYRYAYGHKTQSRREQVTADTCYRIASVTKLVSAVGLMQLLTEKNIPLDTPVSDIVGYPVVNPAFPGERITIRQVMSHTSSLVQTQYYHPNWETLKVNNKYFSQKVAPGTAYAYSNLNGGLMGAMIEALSGQSVNTYMQAHVFGPLGINAAYHMGLLKDQSDMAPQLAKDGTIAEGLSVMLASLPEYNDTCDPRANTSHTSGDLCISANGLIRVIAMLEQGGELDGVRILPKEAVQLMMQDQQTIPSSSVHCDSEYGLAIARVEGMPGGTWYGHQGRKHGLSSNVYFQPDTGLSIAVIANGYEAHAEDNVVTIARAMMKKAQEFVQE
ncbi:MAG: serine hydrolase [Clostridiales bacterium]|nr:serine hydrolase [Clostridiales bacterium]